MFLSSRINPFLIQCFVTAGVSINMGSIGLVLGFSAVLLPQLRLPNSDIQIDDSSGSWIAALPGITVIAGNLIVPPIMGCLGRKVANLISLVVAIIGWLCIYLSYNIQGLIAARFVQGTAMGMITALGPILIGEYTSPKNRGAFLMTISMMISLNILIIQAIGSYLSWRITAMICIAINVVNLIIVIISPETPTFLADKGKYDECRKVFEYLRGINENDELEKMIVACYRKKENTKASTMTDNIKMKFNYLGVTIKKKEFYRPMLVMLHLYALAQWGGINILTSYTADLFTFVVGPELDLRMMIIILAIHRMVASCVALILIKTIRRRTMLLISVILNLVINLSLSGYTYAKAYNYLTYDHPAVGVVLIHLQLFIITTGALPLSYIIAGEIFPREYKSLCGCLSNVFMSLNQFSCLKTVPLLFKSIGVYGSYCVYCVIIVYCLFYTTLSLPETKNKTLQDIEEEFREKRFWQFKLCCEKLHD